MIFLCTYYKFNFVLDDLKLKVTEELSKHDFENQNCGRFCPKLLLQNFLLLNDSKFFLLFVLSERPVTFREYIVILSPCIEIRNKRWECSFVKSVEKEVIPKLPGFVTRRSKSR